MKGIILAGGSGTRLHPITRGISKQLMPVYDKPMIYYPLSTLMMAGIREVLIITTPQDLEPVPSGCSATARPGASRSPMPSSPVPTARAGLHHRRRLHRPGPVALVLGDNIFYGTGLGTSLRKNTGLKGVTCSPTTSRAERLRRGRVRRRRHGALDRGEAGQPEVELRGPGLYFYDNDVVEIART
jgi:glucose-1-phosphate thymidylyltransferase